MHEIAHYGVVHATFIVILLLSKKRKPVHESILIGWFIFLALPLLSRILEPDMLDIPVYVLQLHLMFPITFGPFLWLYIKSLTHGEKQFDRRDLLHFLPFILLTSYQIIFDKTFNALERMEVDYTSIFDYVIVFVNIISMTYYSLISVLRLKKHGKEVLNHFSELPSQVTLKWLYWISAWFILTYFISSMSSLLSLPNIVLSPSYTLTFFVFILSFFSLKQTAIFSEMYIDSSPQALITEDKNSKDEKPYIAPLKNNELSEIENITPSPLSDLNNKTKYERSGLTRDKASKYLQKLEDYMASQKPYLDANLTIEKLSKQIAIPRHYLTQIISEQLNKNFYLFINEYRINTVKHYIDDAENNPLSMLEIAYQSGFNSKSTFNVAFKKLTSMTPSQYKKQKY
ncbi:helix-turn-helix domain-containing protein [Psychromonas sp. PT13]|uniref:helix-turn-helix domain-containing protein n=1 Tax=Psychromonas sp. PT13 TaxID=3439547 RepID=UPI003EB6A212